MAARPTVTVYAGSGEASGSLALPAVFTAPIRLDVVQQVHSECRRHIEAARMEFERSGSGIFKHGTRKRWRRGNPDGREMNSRVMLAKIAWTAAEMPAIDQYQRADENVAIR